MIAVIVLLSMLFGGGTNLPIPEIVLLSAIFCVFFGAGIYIAAALGILGLLIGFTFSDRPFWNFAGEVIWNPSHNYVFVAVPLFLLMGEILLRAGLSDRLYKALNV